jgi:hypothetical protein
MNAKVLVAGIIGGIAFFFLGWLIWGIALMDIMSAHSNAACMKPEAEMNMVYLVIANLLWGIVFAYIFSNWTGVNSFNAGLLRGAILSVLIGLTMDLYSLSMTTMMTSTTPMLINVAANAVVGGIVGGIVSWWLGRK